jgi:hypothetical protein
MYTEVSDAGQKGLLRQRALDGGFESVTDSFGPFGISTDDVGGKANLHAEADVGWIGGSIDDVAADTGSVAIDNCGREGHRDARCGKGDDGEGTNDSFSADVDLLEIGSEASGAGVATVEVTSSATGAFIGDEVGTISKYEIVDMGDLLGWCGHP